MGSEGLEGKKRGRVELCGLRAARGGARALERHRHPGGTRLGAGVQKGNRAEIPAFGGTSCRGTQPGFHIPHPGAGRLEVADW